MMTIADGGGPIVYKPDFDWQNMWTAPKNNHVKWSGPAYNPIQVSKRAQLGRLGTWVIPIGYAPTIENCDVLVFFSWW